MEMTDGQQDAGPEPYASYPPTKLPAWLTTTREDG